ncbi:hypothetical protein, partial [uncultured Duodenibacillus sp.]|uniref:hypothetical protein n=1 Tax=Duodenibacillus massiliensis TaxID=1852381 RepID=UPI00258421C1
GADVNQPYVGPCDAVTINPRLQTGVVYVCLLPDGKVVLLVVRVFLLGFTASAGLSDTALSADFMPNCVCAPKRLPKDDTLKSGLKIKLVY